MDLACEHVVCPAIAGAQGRCGGLQVELITFEILAAERLRLMEFDNRLIGDYFANIVILLI